MNEELRKLSKEIWGKEIDKYVLNTEAMLYIQNLKQENERLITELNSLKKQKEELKEWLNTEKCKYHYGIRSGKTLLYGKFLGRLEVLDKINELEGENNDSNV